MAKEKLIGVQWIARSYLSDVEFMDKDVEGTYFRLIQFVYLTQNRLVDDDEKLWKRCKCSSVREYRKHKSELMKHRGIDPATGEEIPPRVVIDVGIDVGVEVRFIRIPKCSQQLGTASRMRHAKSKAGKASANKSKSLRDNETHSTAVATEGTTHETTEASTVSKQTGQQTPQRKDASVVYNLKEVLTEPLSLTLKPEPTSGSSGLTPAARPSTDDRVTVIIPDTGCEIRINAYGIFDIVGGPRGCDPPLLTPDQALALRDAAMNGSSPTGEKPQGLQQVAEKSFAQKPLTSPPAEPEMPARLDRRNWIDGKPPADLAKVSA